MKKIFYIKDEGTNILKATIREDGNTADGCGIQIKKSLLDEAYKKNIAQDMLTKIKKKNIFYKFDDITLVMADIEEEIIDTEKGIIIQGVNRAAIIDSYINNSSIWIADKLCNNHIIYSSIKEKKDPYKHTVELYLQNVRDFDSENAGKKYISIGKVLHDLAIGVLNYKALGQLSANTSLYVYDGKEAHHEGPCWDYRLAWTASLSAEEHDNIHNETTNKSHQIVCEINDLDELKAFLEFIRSTDYKKYFKDTYKK